MLNVEHFCFFTNTQFTVNNLLYEGSWENPAFSLAKCIEWWWQIWLDKWSLVKSTYIISNIHKIRNKDYE